MYGGALICGPSQQEKDLAAQEASFDKVLQSNYSQTFAANQEILSTLNGVLQPIVQAGPNQQGYNGQELSALNTQAIDSNARGVQQTEEAAGRQENAQGGGTQLLPSGVNAQIDAGIQSAGELNLSNQELGITQSNYATGHQNWQNALAGEQAVASGEQPLGYASATNNANSSAFSEADKISTESNQEWSNILGDVLGVATGGISTAIGSLFGGNKQAAPYSPGTNLIYGNDVTGLHG